MTIQIQTRFQEKAGTGTIDMCPMPSAKGLKQIGKLGVLGVTSFTEVNDRDGERYVLAFSRTQKEKLSQDAELVAAGLRLIGVEAAISEVVTKEVVAETEPEQPRISRLQKLRNKLLGATGEVQATL